MLAAALFALAALSTPVAHAHNGGRTSAALLALKLLKSVRPIARQYVLVLKTYSTIPAGARVGEPDRQQHAGLDQQHQLYCSQLPQTIGSEHHPRGLLHHIERHLLRCLTRPRHTSLIAVITEKTRLIRFALWIFYERTLTLGRELEHDSPRFCSTNQL